MNKKGADLNQVFIVLVVVAVILISGYFIYSFFTNKANPIASNLPQFGQNNNPITSLQEVRYDILQDGVQYYDGTSWHDFDLKTGFQTLGDKTLSSEDLKTAFENYYFSKDNRPTRQVYSDSNYKVNIIGISTSNSLEADASHFWEVPGVAFGNWYVGKTHPSYTRGAVVAAVSKSDNSIYGFVYLSNDNKLSFEGASSSSINPFSDSDLQSSVISKISAWRDSVLKTSVSISYTSNNEKQKNNFCPKQYGTELVVGDLSQPASGNICV